MAQVVRPSQGENSDSEDSALNHSPSTVKVLLAEDNLVNQKLAGLLFRKLDAELTVVSTGKEAVDEATRNAYNLILMDVHMPQMDGLEATQVLKKSLGDDCPVIVALTANSMNGDRERMLEAGMDDYLAKPIDYAKLNDLLQRYGRS